MTSSIASGRRRNNIQSNVQGSALSEDYGSKRKVLGRKLKHSNDLVRARNTLEIILLVAAGIFFTCLFRIQGSLQESERHLLRPEDTENRRMRKIGSNIITDLYPLSVSGSFIIFRSDLPSQGAGNMVSGLLSAHLLGLEFNRIVCIDTTIPPNHNFGAGFLEAFQEIHKDAIEKCPTVLDHAWKSYYDNAVKMKENTIHMVSYHNPVNECDAKEKLEDITNHPILFLTANTYPRWPVVPDRFFFQFYAPKQSMLDALPYDTTDHVSVKDGPSHKNNTALPLPPKTVIHLRWPDSVKDERAGLDNATLAALGELVPRDTYLVTNNMAMQQSLVELFGWQYSGWDVVIHSATGKIWDHIKNNTENPPKFGTAEYDKERKVQNLQVWADWYTILQADTVYHTQSEFSLSAVHWVNNRKSFTMQSYDWARKQIGLQGEFWVTGGESVPISKRLQINHQTVSNDELIGELIDSERKLRHFEEEHPEFLRYCHPSSFSRQNQKNDSIWNFLSTFLFMLACGIFILFCQVVPQSISCLISIFAFLVFVRADEIILKFWAA